MQEIARLEGHIDRVWHVSWHPSLELIASCGGDRVVRLWRPDRSAERASSAIDAAGPVETSTGGGAAGEAGGDASVAGTGSGAGTTSTTASPLQPWKCVGVLDEDKSRTMRHCEWSPCGGFLAAACFDGTTVVWKKSTSETGEVSFEAITTLEAHENEVKAVAWNRAGNLLATCGRDKNVWLWEASLDDASVAAASAGAGAGDDVFECVSVLYGHTQDVKSVVFHPTLDVLVSCSYDDTIKVWKEEAGDDWYCAQTLVGHASTVWGVSFDESGDRMVSCSDDKTMIVWSRQPPPSVPSSTPSSPSLPDGPAPQWRVLSTITGEHDRTVFSVHWNKSNGLIASGGADDAIRVFREATRTSPADPTVFSLDSLTPSAHRGDVNCVRWHPRSPELLASAGDDGLVRIWRYSQPCTT